MVFIYILVGVCCPNLQNSTLFQTQKSNFFTLFQTILNTHSYKEVNSSVKCPNMPVGADLRSTGNYLNISYDTLLSTTSQPVNTPVGTRLRSAVNYLNISYDTLLLTTSQPVNTPVGTRLRSAGNYLNISYDTLLLTTSQPVNTPVGTRLRSTGNYLNISYDTLLLTTSQPVNTPVGTRLRSALFNATSRWSLSWCRVRNSASKSSNMLLIPSNMTSWSYCSLKGKHLHG